MSLKRKPAAKPSVLRNGHRVWSFRPSPTSRRLIDDLMSREAQSRSDAIDTAIKRGLWQHMTNAERELTTTY